LFKKILVANRGEIAIRAFRAAFELGAQTVAVFAYEDRDSTHRFKADEAYQIGEIGHPVRAYLSIDEIIRVAKESGADAIYPGYGFLSENPDFARAAAENGLTFIGPGSAVLEMAGNKVTAKEHAISAGVPVLASSEATTDIDQLIAFAESSGDLSVLATPDYLYGLKVGVEHVIEMRKGVMIFVTLEAIGEPDEKGIRNVMATLNGQLRPLLIRDTSIAVTTASAEKADGANPLHIAAPFLGVVTLQVEVGDVIAPGGTVATIEAMKMEAPISSAQGGRVVRLVVPKTQ